MWPYYPIFRLFVAKGGLNTKTELNMPIYPMHLPQLETPDCDLGSTQTQRSLWYRFSEISIYFTCIKPVRDTNEWVTSDLVKCLLSSWTCISVLLKSFSSFLIAAYINIHRLRHQFKGPEVKGKKVKRSKVKSGIRWLTATIIVIINLYSTS